MAERIVSDPAVWDAAVLASGGHLLQSWRWGAFKHRFGWEVERVVAPRPSGNALAQILFRHKAGVSLGYIPRGPVLPPHDSGAADALQARIDQVARKRRALTVIVEPDDSPVAESVRQFGFGPGPAPIQPSRTVKVPLVDDDGLMQQMHPKTRYNVRLALRRGVTIRFADATDQAIGEFYGLMADTASRNLFNIHDESYYREFLRLFGEDAALLFAEIEGRPVAGVIAVAFGDEAIYMYGGTSTKERAHGAGFLIQFEVMRWARERGCQRYDMWGIPAHDPESTVKETGDRLASSSGSDWRGLYEFKTRFGGPIVEYPPPLEKQYHPMLTALARRFYTTGVEE